MTDTATDLRGPEPSIPPPPPAPPVAPAPRAPEPIDLAELAEKMSSGRPTHFPTWWAWVRAGIARQKRASWVALVAAWTALWVAVWVAVAGAVFGAVGAFIAANVFGSDAVAAGAGQSIGIVSVIVGLVAGAVTGFFATLLALIAAGPLQILVGLGSGFVFSSAVLGCVIAGEPISLKMRGYRRMSRRETARLTPMLEELRQRMGLGAVPPVLMSDERVKNAYTCLRHVVVTRGIYDELDDEQLAAVLAHELHHWAVGDTLGLRFVFACAWPLVMLYNFGAWLTRWNHGIVRLLGWVLLWPAMVLVRFLIVPLVRINGRMQEYECDAAAKRAGYGDALHGALQAIGDFEGGRSGWEQVLAATHPPTELRLEALEPDTLELPGQRQGAVVVGGETGA